MQFLVGLLLIVALAFTPAPVPSDSGTKGKIAIQTGTQGTKVGWEIETSGNPRVIIGGEHEIPVE